MFPLTADDGMSDPEGARFETAQRQDIFLIRIGETAIII